MPTGCRGATEDNGGGEEERESLSNPWLRTERASICPCRSHVRGAAHLALASVTCGGVQPIRPMVVMYNGVVPHGPEGLTATRTSRVPTPGQRRVQTLFYSWRTQRRLGLGFDCRKPLANRELSEFCNRIQFKLAHDLMAVCLDCFYAFAQCCRDFLAGHTFGQKLQHLPFSWT